MSEPGRVDKEATDTTLRGPWLAVAWLAWVAIVATAAVVYVAIARLAPLDVGDAQRIEEFDVGFIVVLLALSSGVAAVILWRRRGDWMAMLVALVLVALPLQLTNGLEPYVLAAHPEWRVPFALRDLGGFPLLIGLFYLFPNGRFVPRWTFVIVLVWAFLWLIDGLLSGDWGEVSVTLQFSTLVALAIGLASQAYRYFRISGPVERQQTKWVLFGLTGVLAGMGLWSIDFVVLHEFTGGDVSNVGLAMAAFVVLLFLIFPLSVGTAVLRYRLWDIDVLINRALVYAALTATLTGTYFGSVVLLQMAFRGVTGQGNAVAIVISTLTIAVLFMPLRRRIQDIIDRRFFRRRYDAARTLAAFSSRMRDEVDMDRLTSELVTVVEEAMQPTHVSLWLRNDSADSQQESR